MYHIIGCAVISIADSFSSSEIALRLQLGNAKAIFTQDCIYRSDKVLPLLDRVQQAGSVPAVLFIPFIIYSIL